MTRRQRRQSAARPAPKVHTHAPLSDAWCNYRAALQSGNYSRIQTAVGRLLLHPTLIKWTLTIAFAVVIGTVVLVLALIG